MDKEERIKNFEEVWGNLTFISNPPIEGYFDWWQHLIDTGDAWVIEGYYARTAHELIDDGLCVLPDQPLTEEVIEQRDIIIEERMRQQEEERIRTQPFKTVVIDPPWNERGGGKIKRGADKHYPLLKTPDIISTILSVPQWTQIEENAHLYLWVTNTFLPDGLFVMKALGFTYKTNFVWVKDKMGLGQYFRGQHELCLFGTRGGKPTEPRTDDKSISSVLKATRARHSAKPMSSYDLIEKRSKGGYMEIFARGYREGWFSWGNEV